VAQMILVQARCAMLVAWRRAEGLGMANSGPCAGVRSSGMNGRRCPPACSIEAYPRGPGAAFVIGLAEPRMRVRAAARAAVVESNSLTT